MSLLADEYQKQAMRPALLDRSVEQQLLNVALGLAGEAGEVNDLIKKWIFHGHGLSEAKLDEELGDLLWYVALYCEAVGTSMSALMQGNIEKLLKRYPDKFSPERSRERAE